MSKRLALNGGRMVSTPTAAAILMAERTVQQVEVQISSALLREEIVIKGRCSHFAVFIGSFQPMNTVRSDANGKRQAPRAKLSYGVYSMLGTIGRNLSPQCGNYIGIDEMRWSICIPEIDGYARSGR